MGGKRRNTAKTGDKAIYKKAAEARNNVVSTSKSKGDDSMFNEVDQFHNEREEEFIKLHNNDADSDKEDSDDAQEAVMDLGVGGNSSEEDDDDDSDSDSDADSKEHKINPPSSSSSDDDDDDEEDEEDVRDWGRKKSAYYHGDTADLELGQDEEDAFLEEEAVKDVQTARLEEMDEDDFVLSDDDDDEDKDSKKKKDKSSKKEDETPISSSVSSIRDIAKLSSKDRKKLLEKQHPGLLQILSHFSKSVQDLHDRTSLATGALFEGEDDGTAEAIGCTPMGKKYLLTKALLQASTALNLAIFLLLKAEESSSDNSSSNNNNDAFRGSSSSSLVQFHPVMKRLQDWNVLNQKLKGNVEDSVDGLEEQLDNLIKAAKLMESMAAEGDDDDSEEDEVDTADNNHIEKDVEAPASEPTGVADAADASSSSDDDDSSVDEEAVAKSALQNARFGLRPNEIAQDKAATNRDVRRRRAVPSDLGDEGGEAAGNQDAARYLASAVNTIEQRAASRKKAKKSAPEELFGHKEADDDVRRGVEMMEAELGKLSDEEGGDGDGPLGDDDMGSGDDDDMGFYAQMAKESKDKREQRKNKYAVAPKYPRMEGEIEGERPVGRMIMKNRGLVAHKNKLNRNPRVKKREQYRKALIKRKGNVREVRTDEGHKYGGEETGIKSRISRSRKLGTN